MRIALQSLVILSAAATPYVQGPPDDAKSKVMQTQVQRAPAQAQPAQNQLERWEQKADRLALVDATLETIVEDVIQMSPEEMEVLDPVLLELFTKKEELGEIIQMGREGLSQGLITSNDDIQALQEIMEGELAALEEAVTYLRLALDEYIGEQTIEV